MEEKNNRTSQHLDDIDHRLYQRGTVNHSDRHTLSSSLDASTSSAWQGTDANSMPSQRRPSKILRNIVIGALVFCVGAGAFMMISLAGGRSSVSNDNITLTAEGKTFVDGGENMGYRLSITNGNPVALELVDIVLEYPTTSATTPLRNMEHIRQSVGTILPRQEVTQPFDIVLYGEEGEERDISATLEYRIPGSNAIFTKTHSLRVGIRSSPIAITMKVPDALVADQILGIDVTLTSHALETIPDTLVQLQYPSGFRFISGNPKPSSGTTYWYMDDMAPGEEQTIHIEGILSGDIQSQKTFTALVGTADMKDRDTLATILSSTSRVIGLEAPFIDTKLSLNGVADDRVVLNESDNVRVAITWQNTLPVRVNDMRFSMDLSQLLLDPATIRVQDGRYDSATKTVVWNQDTNDALAFADPGDMGTVSFSFDTKPLVTTIGNDIIQNPTMALAVDVRATDTNGVIYTAEDVDTITLALNSSVTLEQETLHSSGPFASSGAMPPRANQATTYTLHWEIRNSSNALSDVRVTTTLPTGVTWLGKTSPTSEKMNYNAESRTITWNVGSIPAGGGFTTDPRGVYIQIALTPSSSEIGTVLDITRDVILTALDMFTNQTITSTRERHRTQLVGDTIENNGMVVS